LDIRRELTVVRLTGKYILGFRQSYLSVIKRAARAVVLAANCPEDFRASMELAAKASSIPVIKADLTAREIGRVLGRPFGASAVAILDPGNSSILGEEG